MKNYLDYSIENERNFAHQIAIPCVKYRATNFQAKWRESDFQIEILSSDKKNEMMFRNPSRRIWYNWGWFTFKDYLGEVFVWPLYSVIMFTFVSERCEQAGNDWIFVLCVCVTAVTAIAADRTKCLAIRVKMSHISIELRLSAMLKDFLRIVKCVCVRHAMATIRIGNPLNTTETMLLR